MMILDGDLIMQLWISLLAIQCDYFSKKSKVRRKDTEIDDNQDTLSSSVDMGYWNNAQIKCFYLATGILWEFQPLVELCVTNCFLLQWVWFLEDDALNFVSVKQSTSPQPQL